MKKLAVCILIGTLALTVSACGSSSDTDQESAGAEDLEGTTEEVATDKLAAEVEGPGDTVEEPEDEAGEEAAEIETTAYEALEAMDAPDITDARIGSETSETDPVPLGTWVETALYSPQDETYHTVYVRVTNVTTQSQDAEYVDYAIAANNGFGDESDRIDPADFEIPEDGELVVLDYEVYVPADFPSPTYGMTEPKLLFTVRNLSENGFRSPDGSEIYAGMGATENLLVREAGETYEPDKTYGERCIYVMIKDYTDYVAVYFTYPVGTLSDETSEDNMYTVYHSVRPAEEPAPEEEQSEEQPEEQSEEQPEEQSEESGQENEEQE
ncbi:MAG: hypothetical protein LIO56_07515 [Lachnospiraceae bacterium]|nr:hypothetical protein [Lachnospiraceae bacterium]